MLFVPFSCLIHVLKSVLYLDYHISLKFLVFFLASSYKLQVSSQCSSRDCRLPEIDPPSLAGVPPG